MFESPQGLPHLLPSEAYREASWLEREKCGFLDESWHLVGISSELARPGDFMTTSLMGEEIQIRNFGGNLGALSNVCSHRHCLLSSLPKGHSQSLKCQYHGWEYGSDGYTRKIPRARDFVPIDRERLRLSTYQVATCGQLVFVRLASAAEPLEHFLSPMFETLATMFGPGNEPFLRLDLEVEANWKVLIENSLEAYHVESVHPKTFKVAPSEQRSEHHFQERHTSFVTDLPFSSHSTIDLGFQKCEGLFARSLGQPCTRIYQQHHLFPNLLFSFTDAIRLVHCVIPLGPTRSRSLLFQFGIVPVHCDPLRKILARIWGRLEAIITRRIHMEDVAMYPRIQKGLNASRNQGCLARSEERIYRFQEYALNRMSQLNRPLPPNPLLAGN